MRIIVFILFSAFFGTAFSQTKSGIKNSHLKIGEQTELFYELKYKKEDGQLSFFPLAKTITCLRQTKNSKINTEEPVELEILSPFEDTIIQQKQNLLWRGKYKITVWDTGVFIIPPTTISTQDSVYEFEAIMLTVTSPKLEEGKEIYDIKEQFIELPNEYISWLKNNWYWILVGLILLVSLVIYFKRKNKKEQKPLKELSLKERSLLAIDALEKAKMWQKSLMKEHYIELSYILRSYLSSQYNLNLLEKTSYQTCLLLTQKGLEKDTVNTIKNILDYSDLVKFAKSTPSEMDIFKNIAQVKQIIVETSPLEIEHV
ncbi:MAG: hypothetical protein V4622_01540 [Bacteroidota bacterium]